MTGKECEGPVIKSPKTDIMNASDENIVKTSNESEIPAAEKLAMSDDLSGCSTVSKLEASADTETDNLEVCKTEVAAQLEVAESPVTPEPQPADCSSIDDSALGLSKRQLRKRKKFEKHIEQRKAKRVEEKARQKEKNRKIAEETGLTVKKKRNYFKSAIYRSVDVNIVFDLSFSELMSIKDRHKVVQQVQRCYSVNRASPKPLKIHLTGLDEKGTEAFKHSVPGYEGWQVSTLTNESYADQFKMQVEEGKLFYLTAESDECMNELELGNYYVIGGLVDHNSLKGHCHDLAVKKSVPTMRLPISEHLDLKTRHVLTINHVFEILLALNNQDGENGGWKEALTSVIPQRKGLQVKQEAVAEPDSSTSNKDENENTVKVDVEVPNGSD